MHTEWVIDYLFRPTFRAGFAILVTAPSHNAKASSCVSIQVQFGSWLADQPWHKVKSEDVSLLEISAAEASSLYEGLLGAKVSAAPPWVLGLDGDTHILRIASGFNESTYHWWCDLPESWSELEPVVALLRQYADRCRNAT